MVPVITLWPTWLLLVCLNWMLSQEVGDAGLELQQEGRPQYLLSGHVPGITCLQQISHHLMKQENDMCHLEALQGD